MEEDAAIRTPRNAQPEDEQGEAVRQATYSSIHASGRAAQHNGHTFGNVTWNVYGPAESRPSTSASTAAQAVRRPWSVKRRPNTHFTGYGDVLKKLEEALLPLPGSDILETERHYVLQGIGGVGKSETALQFASRHRQKFWGVFWIDLGSLESARSEFARIASLCGWSVTESEDLADRVLSLLSNTTEPWLLLLDNCDDPDVDYSKFIPSNPQGVVLITTRLALCDQYGTAGHSILTGLLTEQGVELLLRTAQIRDADPETSTLIRAIVEQSEAHPLEIMVAGSLVKSGMYSANELGGVLRDKQSELLKNQPKQAKSTYGTIHATFEASAERLVRSNSDGKQAMELLSMLAYFDHTGVPEELLTRAWAWGEQHRFDEEEVDLNVGDVPHDINKLSPAHFDLALGFSWVSTASVPFRRARALLYELSLIEWNHDTLSTSMHPLIHAWARERLSSSEQARFWASAASTLVLSAENSFKWTPYTEQLQRHIEVCCDLRYALDRLESCCSRFDLCRILFRFWWQLYRAHSPWTGPIVEDLERLLDLMPAEGQVADQNYLQLCHIQANEFARRGQVDETIAKERYMLEHWSRLVGPDHRQVLLAQRHLASSLLENELTLAEATDLLEKVKEKEENLPGGPGVARISTLYSLARAYSEQDKSEQAINILEEVVKVERAELPFDHPDALASKHMLGVCYKQAGLYSKAIQNFTEVFEMHKKSLSWDDPRLFNIRLELGTSFGLAGEWHSVAEMLKVMRLIEDRLSQKERFKIDALEAKLCHHNNRPGDAVRLQKREVDFYKESCDPKDKERHTVELNLFLYYIENKDDMEARELLGQLKEYEHLMSNENRSLLRNHEMLLVHEEALQEYEKGNIPQAIAMQERVVEFLREKLPRDSRGLHIREYNLLMFYIDDKRIGEARQLFDQMKEAVHLFTEEDRDKLEELEMSLLYSEALQLHRDGDIEHAIANQERIVEFSRRKNLPRHDHLRYAREYNLVDLCIEDGRAPEARKLLDEMKEVAGDFSDEQREELHGLEADLKALEADRVEHQSTAQPRCNTGRLSPFTTERWRQIIMADRSRGPTQSETRRLEPGSQEKLVDLSIE